MSMYKGINRNIAAKSQCTADLVLVTEAAVESNGPESMLRSFFLGRLCYYYLLMLYRKRSEGVILVTFDFELLWSMSHRNRQYNRINWIWKLVGCIQSLPAAGPLSDCFHICKFYTFWPLRGKGQEFTGTGYIFSLICARAKSSQDRLLGAATPCEWIAF